MAIELYQGQAQQGFTQAQEEQLRRKLDANEIYHRKGAGNKMLAYIKGSTAIAHANEIFGFGKWGYHILRQDVRKACDLQDVVVGLFYETDVELLVLGAAFPVTGCGAASIEAPFNGVSYENARKSSVKDALKLALVNYGDQFGLPLYDGDAEVEMDGATVKVSQVPMHETGKAIPKRVVESKQQPQIATPATKALSPLGAAIARAKESGFITGNDSAKLKASWEEQVIQIFGSLLPDAELKQQGNLDIINALIDEHVGKAS
jgi:recombination DNA repair RAD52 pathway protein